MEEYAPGLALKKRPKVIRKWPICRQAINQTTTQPVQYVVIIGKQH